MNGPDRNSTSSASAYAEIYAAHQVHTLAQMLIQRLNGRTTPERPRNPAGSNAEQAVHMADATQGRWPADSKAPGVVWVPMQPLTYWYP